MNSKGLTKLPYDDRDFSHHEHFGTLGAAQLPTYDFTLYDSFRYAIQVGDTMSALSVRFCVPMQKLCELNGIPDPDRISAGSVITVPALTPSILNQVALDFCTAYTTAEIQSLIFGMPFDPLWQMAKIKEIIGSYQDYGASLRDAAQSVITYGSLPVVLAPFAYTGSETDKPRDFLANWENYPSNMDSFGRKYRDLSFFAVDGPYDSFDNVRSTLLMHQQYRQAVTFGLEWHPEWTEAPGGVIPEIMPASQGEGHDMMIVGQKTIGGNLHLVLQQSWGPNAGDGGFYYFPRTVINQCSTQGYGSYIFSRFNRSGITGSGFLSSFIGMLTAFFK